MTIKRILVPTDFGPDADAAMQYAVELAQQLGASVDLLHVVENTMAAGVWSSPVYTVEIAGLQVNLVRDAKQRLRRSVPSIAGCRSGIGREVLVGAPASTIVEYARQCLADLIVMGASGRTGMARMLMGSVAERVVRTAPCPVLTLRATKHGVTSSERKIA